MPPSNMDRSRPFIAPNFDKDDYRRLDIEHDPHDEYADDYADYQDDARAAAPATPADADPTPTRARYDKKKDRLNLHLSLKGKGTVGVRVQIPNPRAPGQMMTLGNLHMSTQQFIDLEDILEEGCRAMGWKFTTTGNV